MGMQGIRKDDYERAPGRSAMEAGRKTQFRADRGDNRGRRMLAESMQMFEARLQEGWVGKIGFLKSFLKFFSERA